LLASAGATVVPDISSVPEVVTTHDEGKRVLVLNLVTNKVVRDKQAMHGRSVREEPNGEVRNSNIACKEFR
jgi:purine nucleoside phosphorylase